METNAILSLSTEQLRRAAAIKEEIDQLTSELQQIFSSGGPSPSAGASTGKKRGGMSAAGRARIAAAARARWAKVRGDKVATPAASGNGAKGKKRTLSAAARKKIADAARARWAKAKAAGKSSL